MKSLNILVLFFCSTVIISCTKAKVEFEKSVWWTWHWQNVADTSQFFSVGGIPAELHQESGKIQFFYSTRDSILSNFHMERLEDFDYKKRWKLFYTNEDKYLKIQELTDTTIEVFGPVDKRDDLPMNRGIYERLSDFATPPFPDSVLYGEK